MLSLLSDGAWLEVPGTVYSCEGGTARLPWRYNETMYGNTTGVLVTNIDNGVTTTYLTRTGDGVPTLPQERTEAYLNAGITLLDVIPGDSGTYESSVYFTSGKQIHRKATLVVYPEDG